MTLPSGNNNGYGITIKPITIFFESIGFLRGVNQPVRNIRSDFGHLSFLICQLLDPRPAKWEPYLDALTHPFSAPY